MNSTTTASFVPAGSQLHAELSRLLRRGMGYTIQGAADVIEHVDACGTATDSCADVEDVATVNDLVARHAACVEYESAEDWPALYDEDVWELTPAAPANAPVPSEAYLPPDLEPSLADRSSWAELNDREERIDRELDRLADEARAVELMTRGLDAFPAPVCGGSPSPDERPVKLRSWDDRSGVRSRPQPNISDFDHLTAHGCV